MLKVKDIMSEDVISVTPETEITKAAKIARSRENLDIVEENEFVVAAVGQREERHFQDVGIEYYRYVTSAS